MNKINLGISGCMGRMGQQLIKSSKNNKNFKLVSLTENKIINKISFLIYFISIISYGIKRLIFKNKFNIPNNYWYLNSIGGFIVIYISFLSIYRTVTGNGWTWKGRKLHKKFD